MQASYAYSPKPEYPDRARREGKEGRVVLPVRAVQRPTVEHRVVEIDLRSGAWVAGDAPLDELPPDAQHMVVTEPCLRPVPRQQLSVSIAHGAMPGQ